MYMAGFCYLDISFLYSYLGTAFNKTLFINNDKRINLYLLNTMEPVVAQGHKVWLGTRLVVGSIATRGSDLTEEDEIFT